MNLSVVSGLGICQQVTLALLKLLFLWGICFSHTASATLKKTSLTHRHRGKNGRLRDLNHPLTPCDEYLLTLCCVVLSVCAIALLAQACRIFIAIVRKEIQGRLEKGYRQNTRLYSAKHGNSLLDLEDGRQTLRTSAESPNGRVHNSRYVTRYGGIAEEVVDVNGVQKTVLVVKANLPWNGAQDAYTDWFERWNLQGQEERIDRGKDPTHRG